MHENTYLYGLLVISYSCILKYLISLCYSTYCRVHVHDCILTYILLLDGCYDYCVRINVLMQCGQCNIYWLLHAI